MADLEITGQSFRSEHQPQSPPPPPPPPQTQTHHLKKLLGQLQSKVAGGLPGVFAGIVYMIDGHNLTVGVHEIQDILMSLGYKHKSDARTLYKALAGRTATISLRRAAVVLGVKYSDPVNQVKHGKAPVGDSAIHTIQRLSGMHAARHIEKAIVRSEQRQHRHLLNIPQNRLLELLKKKMMEHLPSGGGLLDAVRLFHHGSGTHISYEDFKHAMTNTFNLQLSGKRLRTLFSRFDHHGSGDISIDEFISHVWEPEMNSSSPVMLRANQEKQRLAETLAKAQEQYEKSSLGIKVDQISTLIREKLQQHIHEGGNELLQAFREFHHGHGMEITHEEFVQTLQELGIKLYPRSEYDDLFAHFDKTNTGTISFQEFASEVLRVSDGTQSIMDNRRVSGNELHRQEILQKSRNQQGLLQKNTNLMPILKERLMNHVESGPNEVTRSFQKFKQMGEGLSTEGLTLDDFVPALRRLGVRVNREQSVALFLEIAGSNSSLIDLPALRKHVFTTTLALSGIEAIGEIKKSPPRLKPLHFSKKVQQKLARLPDKTDMRELIRSKLKERMKGGANALLKAFRAFHPGHGLEISPHEFSGVVQHLLEMKLPEAELNLLFTYIDTDGNGAIDYSEFVDEIMTGGKPAIYYGALRGRAKEAHAKDRRKRFGLANPNTARRGQTSGAGAAAGGPRVSPLKKMKPRKHNLTKTGEKRWKQMNHAFAHEDITKTGIISHSIFVNILSTFKLKIDSVELIRLEQRYGSGNGVNYRTFMKDMAGIMSASNANPTQPNEERNTSSRRASNNSNKYQNQPTNEEQATALLKTVIARQWRQLQFSFSQHDVNKTGCLDMRTLMNIFTKADPAMPGMIPFLIPKLKAAKYYSVKRGINYKDMIRDNLDERTTGAVKKMGTGRASDSMHRPMTWRLKDALSRTNKANAIIGRIRLQIGSGSQRKAVLRQFEIRDATHSNAIEKGMLRSMFARLGIKVSASDVKGLSFCFEVPNRKHLFNYKDFLRVVESGF